MIRLNDRESERRQNMCVHILHDECGHPLRILAARMNDTLHHKERFVATAVEDSAKIKALHMISGG